jgi:cell division protein FtsN
VPAAVALLALFGLVGCARDSQDWRSAQQADSQEAYEAFLDRYPQSEFAPQAKERAAQLAEERDWAAATGSDTAAAYQQFVGRHPDGKWTQEARIRIENFNVMAATAPEAAVGDAPAAAVVVAGKSAASVAASPKPAASVAAKPVVASSTRPAATPVAAAQPRPAAASATPDAGGHRVQLGAFSSQVKAESEWTRVRGRFAPLQGLEPRITAVQTPAGRLFRLQADVPSEAGGKALCEQLKASGQACLYVPPR